MKTRRVKEEVSKRFFLDLLEPYSPTLKSGEKIVDVSIKEIFDREGKDSFSLMYTVQEGGGKNST